MIARKFIIKGLVQGVGYRFFTQRSAARHQVRGYVRNLSDGSVEVWAEGLAQSVEEFRHDLAAGPTLASVEGMEESVVDVSERYGSFLVEK
ncbi:MAG: acylphosphatase [Acidobacteriota bacterium]